MWFRWSLEASTSVIVTLSEVWMPPTADFSHVHVAFPLLSPAEAHIPLSLAILLFVLEFLFLVGLRKEGICHQCSSFHSLLVVYISSLEVLGVRHLGLPQYKSKTSKSKTLTLVPVFGKYKHQETFFWVSDSAVASIIWEGHWIAPASRVAGGPTRHQKGKVGMIFQSFVLT